MSGTQAGARFRKENRQQTGFQLTRFLGFQSVYKRRADGETGFTSVTIKSTDLL